MMARFQQVQYTVAEGVGNAAVVIVMNGASSVNVIVNVRTIAGSATSMISINIILLITSSCHMFCSTNGLYNS